MVRARAQMTSRLQRGFTIIELMIALVTLSIVSVVIMQIFTNLNLTYAQQNHLADLQTNLRMAMNQATGLFRNSGACVARGQSAISDMTTNDATDGNNVAGGSDAVQFFYATGTTTYLDEDVEGSSLGSTLDVTSSAGFSRQQRIAVMQLRGGTMKRLLTAIVSDPPTSGTQIPVSSLAWDSGLGVTGDDRKASAGSVVCIEYPRGFSSPTPWLFVDEQERLVLHSSLGGTPSTNNGLVLASGVQSMQISYVLDTDRDDDGDTTVTNVALTAEQRRQVVALRVALLMKTAIADSDYVNTDAYTLGDQSFSGFNDGFRRRALEMTVRVRNFVPPQA
jgi:prepilin-type N-terminal cleavage/methylation domain-containing protein